MKVYKTWQVVLGANEASMKEVESWKKNNCGKGHHGKIKHKRKRREKSMIEFN